jgi:prepilin-type N-terminal cleavage/methylation domain-containing protein
VTLPRQGPRAGFTLAEVAVTLLIVAIGLVLVLQGLTSAKLSAAETHHRKVARELALLTLGQVEAGLFWEELDGGTSNDGDVLTGTYAEEGYEEFNYELIFGEEEFQEDSQGRHDDRQSYHDSWEYDREREERAREKNDDDEDEEQVVEPFQKVRIKVRYPQLTERESALVLERWMPWEQVYGAEEGEETGAEPTGDAN